MTSASGDYFKNLLSSRYGINRVIKTLPDNVPSVKCTNGTFVGKMEGNTAVFLGIPFALPPTGTRRWKLPVPCKPSEGIFQAFFNGKTPIQTEWKSERASYYPQGEDCLYLNIWNSSLSNDHKKTVMVFFHGGSYGWGGTADPLYDGKNFVDANPDIILVTVGYRIGIMGFIDFSEVPGGEDYPHSPNLGIYDQIESLKWIHKNIAYFGGNPDNITIFGESAGGGSVSVLPFFPESKGLFNRIIAQSGSVALTYSKKESLSLAQRLLNESGSKNMSDLISLPEIRLMQINERLNNYNNFPQRDGKIIPIDAYSPYENGSLSNIDILIGTNAHEVNYWISELGGFIPFTLGMRIMYNNHRKLFSRTDAEISDKFINSLHKKKIWRITEFYNELCFRAPALRQAEGHSRNGGSTFVYYWKEPSALPYRGACHAVELAYIFGNIHDTVYTGTTADPNLSNLVMQMWANFAKTGNPSTNKITWKPYTPNCRNTMILQKKPQQIKNFLESRRKHLDKLLKYQINGSYAEIDYKLSPVKIIEGIIEGTELKVSSIYKNKLNKA